jgi:hypothetical protein
VISGFETLPQVLGVLAGLEHEVPKNERHAAQIKASNALFEAERDRMLKEERERIERENEARLRAAGIAKKPA